MSILDYVTNGGMARTGGDLSKDEQKKLTDLLKIFSSEIVIIAREMQIPASILKIKSSTYLFAGKDHFSYHFIFAESPDINSLNFRDLKNYGRVDLKTLTQQIRIDIGEPVWAFSLPINEIDKDASSILKSSAKQYILSLLASQKTPEKKLSNDSLSYPEIATGLEMFRKDFPSGTKTAFIIMQFGKSEAFNKISDVIKEFLKQHNVIGLRADDKEYMEDLFPNVKVYMHSCDFGIAVFDRISNNDFNPNVSLEVGYLMGLGRNVLLLKDETLTSLQSDLTGKLYKSFDTRNPITTIPIQLERWLRDKNYI